MQYALAYDFLQIKINSKGAELCSLIFKEKERIWNASPEIWPRYAPVLFPIVGKLKNNCYTFNKKTYSMSQHGFARDSEFKLISLEENGALFCMESTQETKKIYPFDFVFHITYLIQKNTLSIFYEIENTGNNPMYFSLGAHPGFKIPLEQDEKWEDYFIEFSDDREYQTTHLEDGLLSNSKKTLKLEDRKLFLSDSLFENDALVFEDFQIEKIKLESAKNKCGIVIECKGWPFFGIWSKSGCKKFVCLEPWHGIADEVDSAGNWPQKKGLIALAPGKKWLSSFNMFFY